MLTVLVLAPELYLPIRNVAAQFHASADGAAVAGRLLDLGEAPVGAVAAPRHAAAPDLRTATIRLERVTFAYPGREPPVLDELDFELEAGDSVALVGPSGAGKSTLASLLLRLASRPRAGCSSTARNSRRATSRAWRRAARVVAAAADAPAGERGGEHPARRSGRHLGSAAHCRGRSPARTSSSRALPGGYETVVGDGGRPLSAGQVRRIALARAFLRDAPFADPRRGRLRHLDRESAGIVADAIDRHRGRCTQLLISHREELAERCDRIVRIEGGHLLERVAEVVA